MFSRVLGKERQITMEVGVCKSTRKLLTLVVVTSFLLGMVTYIRLPLVYKHVRAPMSALYRNAVKRIVKYPPAITGNDVKLSLKPEVNTTNMILEYLNLTESDSTLSLKPNTNVTNNTHYYSNSSGSDASQSHKLEVNISTGISVVGDDQFFIFTILSQRAKNRPRCDILYITGWEAKLALDKKYLCCIRFSNGEVMQTNVMTKHSWTEKVALQARQIVCDFSKTAMSEAPKWASLVTTEQACATRQTFHEIGYVEPLEQPQPSFAICGKVLYDKKDPNYLIEWLEYHKDLGADKIVVYTYEDLHEPARRVLDHYVREGEIILETVPLPFVPKLDQFHRHFSVQNNIMWQDEKVPLFDVEQRLKPYTYLAVIDTDEFIVPKAPGVSNFVGLMEHLLKKYPNAGTFRMPSEIHIMSWNKTKPESEFMMEQFGNRTESMIETPKFLIATDRLREGKIWIHEAQPARGFKIIQPDANIDVVLKHYRKCKNRWLVRGSGGTPNRCHGGFQHIRDPHMERVAERIGPSIRRVKALLKL